MTPDNDRQPGAQGEAADLCQRGAARLQEGQFDEALALLDEALRLAPGLAAGHVFRGVVHYRRGELDAAVAAFTEAIRLAPDDAWPYQWRGAAFDALGDRGRAVADHTEAIRLAPGDPENYVNRGVAFYNAGRYDAAVADYGHALRLDPKQARAYRGRALALRQLERYEEALADFKEAGRLEPLDAEGLVEQGLLHLDRREFEAAVADFAEAIRLDPDGARAYKGRGSAFNHQGFHHEAVADYSEALRLAPGDAYAHLNRGLGHHAAGDPDAALADYDEALRLDPKLSAAYRYRAQVYHGWGEGEGALADLDEAARLDPGWADTFAYRGRVLHDLEDFTGAVAAFTEAIRLRPTDASAHAGRGRAWDALGEGGRADADFETAQRLEHEGEEMPEGRTPIATLLQEHFAPTAVADLAITERQLPARVHADLQRAMDEYLRGVTVLHFSGVRKQYNPMGLNLTDLLVRDRNDPAQAVPPQYEEVDVGEDQPVRCLKTGLWLLEQGGTRFAVFLDAATPGAGVRFQVGTANDEAAVRLSQQFFKHLEAGVQQARSYRGKVLSLEWEQSYTGVSTGIKVHRLRRVGRDQVILPRPTLELLERNVIRFVEHRPRLAGAGLATKKGLLFYGPPGTGKMHTLHFLAGELPGVTTLLISAEQVGLLAEYMTLARLLQPSMVVIEDADLIARDRTTMHGGCEEVLLNKLLNEMDGLKEDADVLFILTTNRPEALEAALTSRPGRIDQAIEFPFPDGEGRRKLVRLYSRGLAVPDDVVEATVRKTKGVSAAFIKELMRRAAQFQLERGGPGGVAREDVDGALEELLFRGGSLNRKLLGAQVEEAPLAEE